MNQFQYKGRNASGQIVTGNIDGVSSNAAAEQLISKGITPLQIIKSSSKKTSIDLNTLFEKKPKTVDIIMFSRQMSTLIRAGVPIMQAIDGLTETSENQVFARALQDISNSLHSGRELGQALGQHPKIFPPIFVNIIKVGEHSGLLDDSFKQIASYIELEKETKDSVKSAFRYPMFVFITIFASLIVLNIFVIPNFASMFKQAGANLPITTKILIGFSEFSINYWPFILVGIVGITVGAIKYLGTETGKMNWDRIKMKLPIIGGIIKRATLARFARSLSMSLGAGVPITQCLTLVSKAVDNDYVAEQLQNMRLGVERGESLTRTAKSTQLFTPLVMQMLSVGEETGKTDELLKEIAIFYEQEVANDLKTLSASIEPILITIISTMVLVLALGIFLPMWNISSVT